LIAFSDKTVTKASEDRFNGRTFSLDVLCSSSSSTSALISFLQSNPANNGSNITVNKGGELIVFFVGGCKLLEDAMTCHRVSNHRWGTVLVVVVVVVVVANVPVVVVAAATAAAAVMLLFVVLLLPLRCQKVGRNVSKFSGNVSNDFSPTSTKENKKMEKGVSLKKTLVFGCWFLVCGTLVFGVPRCQHQKPIFQRIIT